MSGLKIQNLSFGYSQNGPCILENINFTANPGEVTSLIGANGAGKSTLLKSLMGLNKAKGDIFIDGKNKTTYAPHQLSKTISFLTQDNTHIPSLTVFEVVLLGRMHQLGMSVDSCELDKVHNILQTLHLQNLADRPYNQLSGGQRRVVDIAQAIVKEPKILIMDEPTANLDMQNDLEIMELIQAYTRAKQTTTLLTLHDLNMACRYSDKLVMLKSKHIYAEGTPQQVINPASIQEVYGVDADITQDANGIPQLKILNSTRAQNYQF
ncbi:ABC transporter ATP-binding protein [Psychrobacter lutiphocae]|uniref:ABC transporter ATP-binding protein n=1 Tax=Psychrobacter lutiphocae TaxID=540500 RepID=UPI0003617C50|nr:ABC transporter ATP-binding protein [Psychrobacter lutiphocae]